MMSTGTYEAVRRAINAVVACEINRTVSTLQAYLPQTLSPETFPDDLRGLLDRSVRREDANLGARALYARNRPLLGMNGQFLKASILLVVMRRCGLDCFIETGTKNGFSSLLVLAQTSLDVRTCEIDRDRYESAGVLLKPFAGRCYLSLEDKRSFLARVVETRDVRAPFFYLDAYDGHVGLHEELTIILKRVAYERFVIVVDDFKVPWDRGFAYDNSPGGTVGMSAIKEAIGSSRRELCVMCPEYPATAETGYPAGFVVIVPASLRACIDDIVPSGLLRSVAA